MDEQTVRKTFKCKLQPTAEQVRAMEVVLRRCRELYNRSPKLTVLSRRGVKRVWFLLHREQFHRSLTATASALPSTGVLTVRRPSGQLL